MNLNKILPLLLILVLTACSSGSSSSGAQVAESEPGTSIPAAYVGVYTGTLNVTASATGITQSDSFPITITVSADGTIRFDGDDPEETFTVGISNTGEFSGNLEINEDPCMGTVGVTGSVNGTTASGTVQGEGECEDGIIRVSVDLSGDFSASK